ncbi:di-heme oxidoredictase family protein [uncultured Sneathiella sp.]|uniref:di-heme oxidoreductase family protein n=1 Tax=uncultured Sneathiella sp. TaxID=879315 RepID=UPI0030EE99AE|tara:strand:+ start:7854 stop:9251 length:1398 start_codon:yes stop_codon:yes gene_type:complete
MKPALWIYTTLLFALVLPIHAVETPRDVLVRITDAPGGETTQPTRGKNSFALPAANINRDQLRIFFFGNKLFNTNWVIAPASVKTLDGLGPTFNRVSCSGCHLRDGRGQPPEKRGDEFLSMLFRLSIPGKNQHGGPNPHPVYGDQLNDRANPSIPAEGKVIIDILEHPGEFSDGTPYSLAEPTYHFTDLAFGPLGPDIMVSPRVAPAVFGLGLLEAIPEADLQALADPDDANNDGISGRLNHVWDETDKSIHIGRFGWKSNAASLRHQNAAAALGDIGITTNFFPEQNCPPAQNECQEVPLGEEPELSDTFLDKLTLYTQTLAVPARRDVTDENVLAGEELFHEAGCATCHVPTFVTGTHPDLNLLSNQKIHPFTDLLLHDMGDELADGRPDFKATGREWRTAPLWGIGLVQSVNKHSRFLHDGRARSIEEAILWHGGEAENAKESFRNMEISKRMQLLAFLNSL